MSILIPLLAVLGVILALVIAAIVGACRLVGHACRHRQTTHQQLSRSAAPANQPGAAGQIVLSLVAGVILIGATALGATSVMASPPDRPAAPTAVPTHNVSAERQAWQLQASDSMAGSASRDEALRTLAMIEEVRAQEARLWNYYDALKDSHSVREELITHRMELERSIHSQQRRLTELEADLERLRPETDSDTINFVQH